MPTLHRVAFDSGSFAVFQLRDFDLPPIVTAQLAASVGSLVAVRDASNGDRWRLAPLRGRRGARVSPLLTTAGVTQAEAVPLLSPVLPGLVLAQLLA